MNVSIPLRALVVPAVLASAMPALALDAYSNLGPSPLVYQGGSAYHIGGFQSIRLAARFVASEGGVLSGFSAALNEPQFPFASPYGFRLYSELPSGEMGDELMYEIGGSTGLPEGTDSSSLSEVPLVGGPTLVAGDAYWVEVEPTLSLSWNLSNAAVGRLYSGGTYFEDVPMPAFAVRVDAVPEPTACAAMGLGVLGVARRRRRA